MTSPRQAIMRLTRRLEFLELRLAERGDRPWAWNTSIAWDRAEVGALRVAIEALERLEKEVAP